MHIHFGACCRSSRRVGPSVGLGLTSRIRLTRDMTTEKWQCDDGGDLLIASCHSRALGYVIKPNRRTAYLGSQSYDARKSSAPRSRDKGPAIPCSPGPKHNVCVVPAGACHSARMDQPSHPSRAPASTLSPQMPVSTATRASWRCANGRTRSLPPLECKRICHSGPAAWALETSAIL